MKAKGHVVLRKKAQFRMKVIQNQLQGQSLPKKLIQGHSRHYTKFTLCTFIGHCSPV